MIKKTLTDDPKNDDEMKNIPVCCCFESFITGLSFCPLMLLLLLLLLSLTGIVFFTFFLISSQKPLSCLFSLYQLTLSICPPLLTLPLPLPSSEKHLSHSPPPPFYLLQNLPFSRPKHIHFACLSSYATTLHTCTTSHIHVRPTHNTFIHSYYHVVQYKVKLYYSYLLIVQKQAQF